MEKETCCECGKELMADEIAICAKCQKEWDDLDAEYANCDECTPIGYYLSDGVYIGCGSAHELGLI